MLNSYIHSTKHAFSHASQMVREVQEKHQLSGPSRVLATSVLQIRTQQENSKEMKCALFNCKMQYKGIAIMHAIIDP
jgi:hypothetical protein